MAKTVAILSMAALTVLAIQFVSDMSPTAFSAISSETGAAPMGPPLMYAGIRG